MGYDPISAFATFTCDKTDFAELMGSYPISLVEIAMREIRLCEYPVIYSLLSPLAPDETPQMLRAPIDPIYVSLLRTAVFGNPRHLGIVELVRRAFKRDAIQRDLVDKQARLGPQC
jgi:hypothetical protein